MASIFEGRTKCRFESELYRAGKDFPEINAILKSLSFKDMEEAYLYFWNDFLTREKFAELHSITLRAANVILDTGKAIHEGKRCSPSPDDIQAVFDGATLY